MPVDQAELRRWHPELRPARADAEVRGQRQLQAAAERVAVERGDHRPGVRRDRVEGVGERVGDERLGVALEALLGDAGDVVAGRERVALARDHDAAGRDPVVEPRHRLRDRVQDVVVEGVARLGREFRSAARPPRRAVEEELPSARSSSRHAAEAIRGRRGRRPRRPTGPPRSGSPSTLPSSSASTGISIFIDSRMTTVSPSATSSPTATSIFQTVPVMCASTSAIARHNIPPCRRKRPPPATSSRPRATRRTGSGTTLDALAAALPGARLFVADDASEDGTAEVAMRHGATVIRRGRTHGKGGNVGAAAEAVALGARWRRGHDPALRRGPRLLRRRAGAARRGGRGRRVRPRGRRLRAPRGRRLRARPRLRARQDRASCAASGPRPRSPASGRCPHRCCGRSSRSRTASAWRSG